MATQEIQIELPQEFKSQLYSQFFDIATQAIEDAQTNNDLLTSKKDCAEWLKVSIDTVNNWINTQKMPVAILGERTFIFSKTDIKQWIASKKAK